MHFHERQARSTKYPSWPEAVAFADTQYERQKNKVCSHPTLELVEERRNHASEEQREVVPLFVESDENEGNEFTVLLCYLYTHVRDPEALAQWFTGWCFAVELWFDRAGSFGAMDAVWLMV